MRNHVEKRFFDPKWVYKFIVLCAIAMIATSCFNPPQTDAVQVTTVPGEAELIIQEAMENILEESPRYYSVGLYSLPFVRGQDIYLGTVKIFCDIGSGLYTVRLNDGHTEEHVIGLDGETFLVESLENGQEVRARVIAIEIVEKNGDYILVVTFEEVLKSPKQIEGHTLAARLNQARYDDSSQPILPESEYQGKRSYITFSYGEPVTIGGRIVEYTVTPSEIVVDGETFWGSEESVFKDGDPLLPVNGRRCFVGDNDAVYCIEGVKPFGPDFSFVIDTIPLY